MTKYVAFILVAAISLSVAVARPLSESHKGSAIQAQTPARIGCGLHRIKEGG